MGNAFFTVRESEGTIFPFARKLKMSNCVTLKGVGWFDDFIPEFLTGFLHNFVVVQIIDEVKK